MRTSRCAPFVTSTGRKHSSHPWRPANSADFLARPRKKNCPGCEGREPHRFHLYWWQVGRSLVGEIGIGACWWHHVSTSSHRIRVPSDQAIQLYWIRTRTRHHLCSGSFRTPVRYTLFSCSGRASNACAVTPEGHPSRLAARGVYPRAVARPFVWYTKAEEAARF